MIKYIITTLLIVSCFTDCPLNHYPRQTVIGHIQAQINNDPTTHQKGEDYVYALSEPFPKTGVKVITSVIGFGLNPTSGINFKVISLPNSNLDSLKFRVKVTDQNYGWRFLKSNFLASQNSLFEMVIKQDLTQFSTGAEEGSYSVYQIIPNFIQFAQEPVIKVFLSGIDATAQQNNNQEILAMENQLQSMRMFSRNQNLIKLLEQALQIRKGLQFKILDAKNVGRLLGFKMQTNMKINSLTFSYIVYSNQALKDKHNSVIGDFTLVDNKKQSITILSNMDMLLVGMTEFNIPQNSLYTFQMNFQQIFNQGFFSLVSNKPYFEMGFSYLALEMKRQFICEDCPDSPIIFEEKLCVQVCPRGFSKLQRLNNLYCDKCQVQKLKVIDPTTDACVCAKRHYLDSKEDTCKPCSYDCYTCETNDRCLTCDNEFMQTRRTKNNQGRCVCPLIGYYENVALEDIVCHKCHQSCRTCDGPRAHDCLTCESGKDLDPLGFCVCQRGFQEFRDGSCYCPAPKVQFSGYCTSESTDCPPNQVAQLVDLTRRCVCVSGFIQVLNQCIKCEGNSRFDQDSLSCVCSNQTVYINGQCQSCGINEVYDEITGICKCAESTFKTEDGNCIKCPKKMGYINGQCQCAFNYFQISPGVCRRCQRQTDGPFCRKSFQVIE